MRLDPNPLCKQPIENKLWAFIHDAIAHPLVAITRYANFAVKFHDYSSRKAWPFAESRLNAEERI